MIGGHLGQLWWGRVFSQGRGEGGWGLREVGHFQVKQAREEKMEMWEASETHLLYL